MWRASGRSRVLLITIRIGLWPPSRLVVSRGLPLRTVFAPTMTASVMARYANTRWREELLTQARRGCYLAIHRHCVLKTGVIKLDQRSSCGTRCAEAVSSIVCVSFLLKLLCASCFVLVDIGAASLLVFRTCRCFSAFESLMLSALHVHPLIIDSSIRGNW